MSTDNQINQLLDRVVHNDINGVERMLEAGADIDYVTKKVYSPLMVAVLQGFPKMTKFLLEKGADMDLVGPEYETAMDMAKKMYEHARRHGNVAEIVAYRDIYGMLRDKGAKTARQLGVVYTDSGKLIEQREEAFFRALCSVARTGKKARLNDFIEKQMGGVVDLVSASWLKEEALAGDIPLIVEVLKDRGVDLNEVDEGDNTFLHYAMAQGKEKVVTQLLKEGVDTTIPNLEGDTALDAAVRANNPQMVQLFLKKKDVSKSGLKELVQEVIDRGQTKTLATILDVKGKAVDLKGAFWYALKDKSDLKYREDKLDVEMGQRARALCAKMLLDAGLKAKGLENEEGVPVLQVCAKEPALNPLIPLLVEKGADINTLTDEYGNTPLMVALSKGLDAFALKLIKDGYDVNKPNNKGATPLIMAAASGAKADLIGALVDKGANVDYELPVTHQNALIVAAESGHLHTVKALEPLYPNLKEDGINGLMRVEKELFRNSPDYNAARSFIDGVRKSKAAALKAAKMAERRAKIEQRKESFKKMWGKMRAVFGRKSDGR